MKDKSQQAISATDGEHQLPTVGGKFGKTESTDGGNDGNVITELKKLLSEPLVVEFEKKDNLITRLTSRFPDSKLVSETHLFFNYNGKKFGIHIDDSKIHNISELDSNGSFNQKLTAIWKEDLSGIERFETNSLIPYNSDSNISVDELLEMIK